MIVLIVLLLRTTYTDKTFLEQSVLLKTSPNHRIKDDRMENSVDIWSSSQSSIAALKNVLADGRLTSSPPLPPPHTLFRTHRPPLYPIPIPIGAVCGIARGCGKGKGSRARQSATLCRSRAQNNTCGKRAVPYSYSLYTVFHSVIFNSVAVGLPPCPKCTYSMTIVFFEKKKICVLSHIEYNCTYDNRIFYEFVMYSHTYVQYNWTGGAGLFFICKM